MPPATTSVSTPTTHSLKKLQELTSLSSSWFQRRKQHNARAHVSLSYKEQSCWNSRKDVSTTKNNFINTKEITGQELLIQKWGKFRSTLKKTYPLQLDKVSLDKLHKLQEQFHLHPIEIIEFTSKTWVTSGQPPYTYWLFEI